MAWVHRRGCRYMYRSYRVGGKVRRKYLGAGAYALRYERLLQERRQEAQVRRDRHLQNHQWATRLRAQASLVSDVMAATLLVQGYWRPQRVWRRCRLYRGLDHGCGPTQAHQDTVPPLPPPQALALLQALVAQFKQTPDAAGLTAIMRCWHAYADILPHAIQRVTARCRQLQDLLVQSDPLASFDLEAQIAALQSKLAPATPLEQLLAADCLATWLFWRLAVLGAQARDSARQARRARGARQRYQRARGRLATVQRLGICQPAITSQDAMLPMR